MPRLARTLKAEEKPPRPRNAWILYRSDMVKNLPDLEPGQPKRPQADASKAIAVMWKGETAEIRAEYQRQAEREKEEHAIKYPGYRFLPRKKDKE
ncbi:HMG-box, partial [Auriscalpium vulgare]